MLRRSPLQAFSVLLPLVAAAYAWGCARQGRPSGGSDDRIPPMVISTWPDTFETIEPTRDPIVITYSERISERPTEGRLGDAVVVSPETGRYEVKHKRTSLEVKVAGGWKPGLVYRVRVQNTIKDLFNNRMDGPFELVFCVSDAPRKQCPRKDECVASDMWLDISKQIGDFFDSIAISDLCDRARDAGVQREYDHPYTYHI